MSVSVLSAVQSLITYIQNIGLSISIPNVKLPKWLENIVLSFNAIIQVIQNLIPSIPKFDIRASLVIYAVIIPFLLHLLFISVVLPLKKIILHLLDSAGVFLISFGISAFITSDWIWVHVVLFLGGLTYVSVRIAWILKYKKENNLDLVQTAEEVCKHFMSGVIPGVESDMSLEEIDSILSKYSDVIRILPSSAPAYFTIITCLIAVISLFFLLWTIELIPIPQIGSNFAVFYPFVGIPVFIWSSVTFVLRLNGSGRRFLLRAKSFLVRWGMRGMMFGLELLYIPIGSIVIRSLIPKNTGCDEGYYSMITTNSSFEVRDFECIRCSLPVQGQCIRECSGSRSMRLYESPALLYVNDVMKVSGPLMLYGIAFIIVGIPLLFSVIIKRNKRFLTSVYVYGHDMEEKWSAVLKRIGSTGIYLFQFYKYTHSSWSIFLFFFKFIAMTLNILISKIDSKIAYVIPVFYFLLSILSLWVKPYLNNLNSYIESVFFSLNMVFSLFSVISGLSTTFYIVFSIILIVFPVLFVVYMFFVNFRDRRTHAEDPTYEEEDSQNNIFEISDNKDVIGGEPHTIAETKSFVKILSLAHYPTLAEDDVIEFPEGSLNSIKDIQENARHKAFSFSKKEIAHRITHMYTILDAMIDGFTIDTVLNVLSYTVLGSFLAAGWYFGSLLGSETPEPLVC